MVYQSFLIKYAEIGTKGKNRYLFEDALIKQIKNALKKVEGSFIASKESGRIYVQALSEYDYDEVIEAFAERFDITVSAHGAGRETIVFNLPRELRVA